MRIDIDVHEYNLDQLWDLRQQDLARQQKAAETWAKVEDPDREALEILVTEAFLRLLDDKSWLPHSLSMDKETIKEGTTIDINLKIFFSDISFQTLRRRAEMHKNFVEAAKGTDEILTEFDKPGPGDVEDEVEPE